MKKIALALSLIGMASVANAQGEPILGGTLTTGAVVGGVVGLVVLTAIVTDDSAGTTSTP